MLHLPTAMGLRRALPGTAKLRDWGCLQLCLLPLSIICSPHQQSPHPHSCVAPSTPGHPCPFFAQTPCHHPSPMRASLTVPTCNQSRHPTRTTTQASFILSPGSGMYTLAGA